jgi:hypothetical protein
VAAGQEKLPRDVAKSIMFPCRLLPIISLLIVH